MISVVQSKYQSTGATLTPTATLDAPPTDGNYLIAAYRTTTAAEVLTLPAGWAWATGSPYNAGTTRGGGIAYKLVAGDSATVSFTSDTSGTKILCVVEVAGLAATGVLGPVATSAQTIGATSKDTGSTGVLPAAAMYAIGLVNLASLSGGTNAVDSGFTLRGVAAGTSESLLVADKITAATTALDPSFTWLTARSAFGQIATFKAAVAPDAPTGVTAVAGDTEATVSWTPPANDGGQPITGYTITRYIAGTPSGTTPAAAGATSIDVTGLVNGTAYTFSVKATNIIGTGPDSTQSAPVTPASAAQPESTVPDVSHSPIVKVWKPAGALWAWVTNVTYRSLVAECRPLGGGTLNLEVSWGLQAAKILRNHLVTIDFRSERRTFYVSGRPVRSEAEDGQAVLTVRGREAYDILAWDLAWPDPAEPLGDQPYHDPAAPAPYVGPAETVCLDLIAENFRDRRGEDLVVPASLGRGATVRARPAFGNNNLADLVARKAKRGGIGIRLNLIDTTSSTRAELTVFAYEPVDRSNRVEFSAARSTLRTWEYDDTEPTLTDAITGGAGTGASQVFRRVSTTESDAAASSWGGHRVGYVDGPDSFDNTELDQAGQEALDEGAGEQSLKVEASEPAGSRWLTHFDVGDTVHVKLLTGAEFDDALSAVRLDAGDAGVKVIPIIGDDSGGDPQLRIAKLIRAMRQQLRALQQRRG